MHNVYNMNRRIRKQSARMATVKRLDKLTRRKNPRGAYIVSAGRQRDRVTEIARFKSKTTAVWFAKKYHKLMPREYITVR